MQTKLYNQEGKVIGSAMLEPTMFELPLNRGLVSRAVLTQRANARQVVAHTKTRSEVRGGGRKPWRQKGTGRARHGSIRSPIWVGGGVTFGPRSDRSFGRAINRKELRKALFMTLSEKARADHVIVLDDLAFTESKTKHMAELLKNLSLDERPTLVVQPRPDQTVVKAGRNLPHVTTILANSLNVFDVLRHDFLLLPKASLDVLKKTYLRST